MTLKTDCQEDFKTEDNFTLDFFSNMGSSAVLLQSYYLYSALLALMVLGMPFIASVLSCPGVQGRVCVSDLKQLTPFWLIAAFYTTTSPDVTTAVCLFRMFVATKFMNLLGMATPTPRCVEEAAFAMSVAITTYMGVMVVYAYRDAF
ncbi:uncharacterized protein LOC134668342 [Cydia fagiglandana]|uniref:uncharacterized protein LOC134668342 n=1 Tax=Cydia fagiglandana TaxID=1458189 RepID=UPI002FEE5FB4